ncbi:MAG TPA: hypothetical protein VFF06_15695 [Polyangia bacterium]|nr:hypothetical protein [Polyangia bacterium]
MGEPQIKGVALRGMLAAARKLHGDSFLEAMLAHLPPQTARLVRAGGFLSGGWYPLATFRELNHAAQRAAGLGPELSRALAREATADDFRGIYRVLTFVLSPEFVIKRAPTLFSRYYDTGRMEVVRAVSGSAQARFSGCVGFDRSVWQGVAGGCVAVLEACGGQDVDVRATDGGNDGDEHLFLAATWK